MRKGLALVDIVREVTMYGTKGNVFYTMLIYSHTNPQVYFQVCFQNQNAIYYPSQANQ